MCFILDNGVLSQRKGTEPRLKVTELRSGQGGTGSQGVGLRDKSGSVSLPQKERPLAPQACASPPGLGCHRGVWAAPGNSLAADGFFFEPVCQSCRLKSHPQPINLSWGWSISGWEAGFGQGRGSCQGDPGARGAGARTRSMEVPGGMLRGVRVAQNRQEPKRRGANPRRSSSHPPPWMMLLELWG